MDAAGRSQRTSPLPPNVAEARTRRTMLAAADYGLTTLFLKVSPSIGSPSKRSLIFGRRPIMATAADGAAGQVE